jgi:hypothetical protein
MTGMPVSANETLRAEHTVPDSPDELPDQTEYDLTLD